MGNCVFSGFSEVEGFMVKVVTFNGGVMELLPPVTAECITNGFPGHGIFRDQSSFSKPLLHNEELAPGELYYLRPLTTSVGGLPSLVAPYRISFDHHQVLPKWQMGDCSGFWKVKLVIRPAQLHEILAQEPRTEALVESMRTVAKCGSGNSTSSLSSSDQWSLSSSRKACSENMGLSLTSGEK